MDNFFKQINPWLQTQAGITLGNMGDMASKIGHNVADTLSPHPLVSPLVEDNSQTPIAQPSLFDKWRNPKLDMPTDKPANAAPPVQKLVLGQNYAPEQPVPTMMPQPVVAQTTPQENPWQKMGDIARNIIHPQAQASAAPSAFQWSSNWKPQFAPLYEKYAPQAGITPDLVKVIVTSENGREDPTYQNANGNGTVDTGLMQINTSTSDQAEQQRLMNPDYNVQKGMALLQNRISNLGDPVLAAASYNLGQGGAVLNPMAALERAQTIYRHAGVPLPETPFTKDPQGFVNANMSKYKSLGLFK